MGKKDHKEKGDSAENVVVLVRARPLSEREKDAGHTSAIDLDLSAGTVQVNHVMGEPDRWTFDAVINNSLSQRDIFMQYITPLVDQVLTGFNSTVFAYGQSGSGKTWTMSGKVDDMELMGITPRCFQYIFDKARTDQKTHPDRKYSLSCSFVELYNNKVRDLLADKQETLDVKENKDKSFYVRGALFPQCKTVDELMQHVDEGTNRRQTAATDLNADSSRSHSIFTVMVEMVETTDDGDVRSVTSKLNLVDLAGSERLSKTNATGDTLREGCSINSSLSNLGTVIDSIVKGKPHIPFRSNPLTMLLKDSLGGNSKTVMFANINPSSNNTAETVSTLRFADRAKQIKNKPVIQLDAKDQKIKDLMDHIAELKDKLKLFEGAGVKGLEDELENLREKLGDAEVALENAENSRATDRSEFLERLQTLEVERDELAKQTKELTLQLEGGKGELDIFSQRLRNESKRRADWKEMLAVELGLPPPPPPSPSAASGDDAATSPAGEGADDIEAILTAIRDVKNTYIDPAVHEQKLGDLEARRKSAEQQADELSAQLDALKQELNEATLSLDQATKKGDRLKEKLDREKESRRQMADTDVAAVSPQRDNSFSAGAANGQSFRRRSVADLRTMMGGGGAFGGGNGEQHAADMAAKDKVIAALREQAAGNAELVALQEELDRSKAAGKEARAALEQQVSALTESLAAPAGDDSPRAQLMKKALLAKDAAVTTALAQAGRLEQKLSELLQMRRAVASGDVRAVEGDVIGAQCKLREAVAQDLGAVVEHRNSLLELIAAGGSIEGDLKAQVEQVVAENKKLRAVAKDHDAKEAAAMGGGAEAEALRAALADHKKAASDAVNMAARQSDELRTKIGDLEEEMAKAEERAIDRFLSEHSKKKDGAGGGDEEDEEDGDDPLRTALRVLQREKTALQSEVNMMSRDLHATRVELALRSGGGGVSTTQQQGPGGAMLDESALETSQHIEDGSYEALRNECLRLRAMLGASGSPATSSPARSPGAPSKSPTSTLGGTTGAAGQEPGSVDVDAFTSGPLDLQASFVEIEHNIQSQVNAANLQVTELREELETAKQELEDAVERRDAATKDRAAAQQEAAELKQQTRTLQQQLEDTKSRVSELEDEGAKSKAQLEQQFATQILSLEGRLRERGDQLAEQKQLVERQTGVAASFKERAEMAQAELDKATAEAAARERKLHDRMEQQEASFQKMASRRLEEQKEVHTQALIRKDEENYELRKKMRKLEDKLDKLRGAYDEKVCEYEEVAGALEEQKVELMKHVRGGGGGGGGSSSSSSSNAPNKVVASRDKYDDQIRQAREARQQRNDAFYETSNQPRTPLGPVGGMPPISGQPNVVANIRREMGHGAPPNYANSARGGAGSSAAAAASGPSTARRVVVDNDNFRGGGAGYTGYQPPIAPSLAPLPPPGHAPLGAAPRGSNFPTLSPVGAASNPFGINIGPQSGHQESSHDDTYDF